VSERRRTLLGKWNQPTHRSDSSRNLDDTLEADAPTKSKFHLSFRRNNKEVVKRVGRRVDEEGVVVQADQVYRGRQLDGREVRGGRQGVVSRVQPKLNSFARLSVFAKRMW
jgi:hypothetical protein